MTVHDMYLPTWRPWFALYGRMVRSKDDGEEEGEPELSPIEELIPDDVIIAEIFHRLPSHTLGVLACVCKHFRRLVSCDSLYRRHCLIAWQTCPLDQTLEILKKEYRMCWRTMFLDRTRLRFEGLYISRNQYVKVGLQEWNSRRGIAVAIYFRYFRFLPDGRFFYRVCPEYPRHVYKALRRADRRGEGEGRGRVYVGEGGIYDTVDGGEAGLSTSYGGDLGGAFVNSTRDTAKDSITQGRYRIVGDKIYLQLLYDTGRPTMQTEIRWKMRLRSTCRGAHNRLDVLSLYSYDREDRSFTPLAEPGVGTQHVEDWEGGSSDAVTAQRHNRGLNTFVFIGWEHIQDHDINLPPEKMDVWIPG